MCIVTLQFSAKDLIHPSKQLAKHFRLKGKRKDRIHLENPSANINSTMEYIHSYSVHILILHNFAVYVSISLYRSAIETNVLESLHVLDIISIYISIRKV